ncbi:MAG: ABC transporter ATP-binding protein [Capsulimonadales bacterium]|nr:ABC transporter ATP-binding protein [Capsulimonadales bacterium]
MSAPAPRNGSSLSPVEIRRRLLGYLAQYRFPLIGGLVAGTTVASIQGWIMKQISVYIESLNRGNVGTLAWVCVGVVGLYAVMGVLKYAQNVLLATVAQRVGVRIRRDIYAHLQTLSLAYFHQRRTGALMSALTNDVAKLQNAAMMMKEIVATPLQLVIYLGFMISISWQMTFFTLLVVPFIAVAIQRLTRRLRRISQTTQERLADVSAVMEETISAPRIVRAFVAEDRELKRFETVSDLAVNSQLKVVRRSGRLGPIVDVIGAAGVSAILFFGGQQVVAQQMNSGSLIAFIGIASLVANAANGMGNLKAGWEEMMGAADRIFSEILDVTPDIRDAPGAKDLPTIQGRIEFDRVEFAYVPGIPVLSGIDLTIEPGQVVALVGETGAGKTTLADLVPRFYDPTGGAVRVDGVDLRTVTVASLRRQIGIVPQDTLLFSGTIRDNIAYGRPEATDAEVAEAARAANIAPFIESLPDGYASRIAERGASVSGGQRQRIAIARALLADPRILILDEATSALDAATEAMVQEALERLMKGRTTLLIAHRLSTIVNADKIVVLKRGGCIAEMGTHAELMARNGVYAALFETQRRSAAIGSETSEGAA